MSNVDISETVKGRNTIQSAL